MHFLVLSVAALTLLGTACSPKQRSESDYLVERTVMAEEPIGSDQHTYVAISDTFAVKNTGALFVKVNHFDQDGYGGDYLTLMTAEPNIRVGDKLVVKNVTVENHGALLMIMAEKAPTPIGH